MNNDLSVEAFKEGLMERLEGPIVLVNEFIYKHLHSDEHRRVAQEVVVNEYLRWSGMGQKWGNQPRFSWLNKARQNNCQTLSTLLLESNRVTSGDRDYFLREACVTGHLSDCELAIRTGSDIHKEWNSERLGLTTPLIAACALDKPFPLGIAELLLSAGADPNHATSDGATALHVAVHNGSVRLVALLLNHGADVSTVDEEGVSAEQLANSLCKQSPQTLAYAVIKDLIEVFIMKKELEIAIPVQVPLMGNRSMKL